MDVRVARLPIITHRRDIDVRIVLGQSIFDLYQQIQNIIQRECPGLNNFFAEPLSNAVRGEITWNTKANGEIKSAADFSSEERSLSLSKLKKNASEITQLIDKLEKSGRGSSAAALAFRGMLITPDLNKSLFRVGEHLVLAQWGCFEHGTDAKSADLFEQIDRQPKYEIPIELGLPKADVSIEQGLGPRNDEVQLPNPPKAEPLKKSPEPESSFDKVPPLTTGVYVDAPIYKNPFFWRWLILLLLLLLLLIGFFSKFGYIRLQGNENALRTEVLELWERVDKKIRDCGLPAIPRTDTEALPTPPISNDEFRNRQSENQIKTNRKFNVSLAWNDPADLDLLVKQPDGELVYFKPCESSTCGTLDVDANRCDPRYPCTSLTDRPLENISWPNNMIPGKYEVKVHMYSTNRQRSEIKSVPFTVQVTENGRQTTYQGVINPQDVTCKAVCSSVLKHITEFTVQPQ